MINRDLDVLSYWIKNAPFRIARRSWLVLENLKGQSTKSLATSVAMTEQRVEDLIDRYRKLGLFGLFEMPRSGKPQAHREMNIQKAIWVTQSIGQELTARQIAERLNSSADAVWREARAGNLKISRKINRSLRVRTELSAELPLLACILSKEFQMLVVATDPGKASFLEPEGVLDGASRELTSALTASRQTRGFDWLESVIALANSASSDYPSRAALERQTRLMNRLNQLYQRNGIKMRFHISGNVASNSYRQWINALQRSLNYQEQTGSAFSFYVDMDSLLRSDEFNAKVGNVSPFWKSFDWRDISMLKEALVWYRYESEFPI